jgi:hypothetical protein
VNELLDLGQRVRLDVEAWVRMEGMGPGVVCVVWDCAEGNSGVELRELAEQDRVVHVRDRGEARLRERDGGGAEKGAVQFVFMVVEDWSLSFRTLMRSSGGSRISSMWSRLARMLQSGK